ncbi:hypothetical protein H8959_016466 [Pygathrix nigripes]
MRNEVGTSQVVGVERRKEPAETGWPAESWSWRKKYPVCISQGKNASNLVFYLATEIPKMLGFSRASDFSSSLSYLERKGLHVLLQTPELLCNSSAESLQLPGAECCHRETRGLFCKSLTNLINPLTSEHSTGFPIIYIP